MSIQHHKNLKHWYLWYI